MRLCEFTIPKLPNELSSTQDTELSHFADDKKAQSYETDRITGGSRTAATSNMRRYVIIVNGWKPLTIITKRSTLDVAAALDPPLRII